VGGPIWRRISNASNPSSEKDLPFHHQGLKTSSEMCSSLISLGAFVSSWHDFSAASLYSDIAAGVSFFSCNDHLASGNGVFTGNNDIFALHNVNRSSCSGDFFEAMTTSCPAKPP
jgi:hypothetical protein